VNRVHTGENAVHTERETIHSEGLAKRWPLVLLVGKDRIWSERMVTTLEIASCPAPLYLSSIRQRRQPTFEPVLVDDLTEIER